MMSSGDLVAEVRARLEAGASEQEKHLLRKRLSRDALLAALTLGVPALFGDFARFSTVWRMVTIGIAALLPIIFWWRYRRIGKSQPHGVTEEEVANVVRKSARCRSCGSLVLPEAAGECLQCGRFVKPLEPLLTTALFLALIIGTVLWRVYH
jgi:hypothetical protein